MPCKVREVKGRACLGNQEIFGVAKTWMWGVTAYESGATLRMTSCNAIASSILAEDWLGSFKNIDVGVPPRDSYLIDLSSGLASGTTKAPQVTLICSHG